MAPDYPGFGYSGTPDPAAFSYTFDGYSQFLRQFTEELGLDRYAIYLHDYGSQFGLRLAMAAPEKVAALAISNGDIYEDEHGPKYGPLKEFWGHPTEEGRRALGQAVTEEGFRAEFVGEVSEELVERVTPDPWKLSWSVMGTSERRENTVNLLADQRHTVVWFSREQAYLREHRPPTLIVWAPGRLPAERRRTRLPPRSPGRRAASGRTGLAVDHPGSTGRDQRPVGVRVARCNSAICGWLCRHPGGKPTSDTTAS